MTRRVSCMERHTAKYSEIQPNSIQPAIQPCRACRGSGAWPGCAQAAVHAAMGAGYRPTPSVTPSSPTGTLSACVSVRHLVLYSRNTIRVTHGAAPCTLMQCSNDASQCRCTRAVAHRGARCNPVHHHRDAPRCRCTQVVVHRGARCNTVHGGARDHQIVSQNPSSSGLDFRV